MIMYPILYVRKYINDKHQGVNLIKDNQSNFLDFNIPPNRYTEESKNGEICFEFKANFD